MEYWDIYDIDRMMINRTMIRENSFAEGDYHLVVHVCIFNSKGEMLIQQRKYFKEGWPNLWDITIGGSVLQGESSQSAAERELFEELSVKFNLQGIRPKLTINFDEGFDDVYLIESNVRLEDLKLQYEEVQNVRWASKGDIISLINKEAFIPYYPSLIELLFDIRKKYGWHSK